MSSWQTMRDLYDDIEVPIALVRFAREIVLEVIEEAHISPAAKTERLRRSILPWAAGMSPPTLRRIS